MIPVGGLLTSVFEMITHGIRSAMTRNKEKSEAHESMKRRDK